LIDLWEVSKVQPQELADHPESPPHFPWIWGWLFDLPSPITWTEIKAWSEISGINPDRWEAEMLIRLDVLRQ
jgi:hypothetical protein